MRKEHLQPFLNKHVSIAVPNKFDLKKPFYYKGFITRISNDTVFLITSDNKTMTVLIDWIVQVYER